MSASAARSSARNAETHAPVVHARAANDAGDAAPAPMKLTAAQRARCLARAVALDPAAVKAPGAYVHERIAYLVALYATAWRDRGAIAAIDLGPNSVSVRDVEDFGERVLFARELVDDEAVAPALVGFEGVVRMPDAALRGAMRDRRARLCDALKLRCTDDASRKLLRRARAARRVADHGRGNRALFALCKGAGVVAWLRALPRGEGAALDQLVALDAEWTRRQQPLAAPADAPPADLGPRALCVAREPLARILAIGRYLTRGRAERDGDYAGFRPPRRQKRALKPAAPATP